MGDGATSELIFRSIYYMLNEVVNLVKYGVFILLAMVMFFLAEFWSCYFGLRQFKLMNVSVIICDLHGVKII